MSRYTSEHYKYIHSKCDARRRGIPFLMTFEEWIGMWKASGHWEQRGWRRGQYVMARPGDKGPYEIGNVKICLAEENRAERNQNYPLPPEKGRFFGKNPWADLTPEQRDAWKAAINKWSTGRRKSAEEIAKQIASRKRNGIPLSPEQRAKMSAGQKRRYASENATSLATHALMQSRRRVSRNGRYAWAHPGDADYPMEAA